MAGLYASVLDVRSLDALEKAILECLASSLTFGVFQETRSFGRGIGVIIQRFVPFQRGGVAFSRDPLTDDANTIVQNYGRGSIENIVSGRGDNAILKIDRTDVMSRTNGISRTNSIGTTDPIGKTAAISEPDAISEIDENSKPDAISRSDKIGKTDKVDKSGGLSDSSSLPTGPVKALVDYLWSIEESWGSPIDMEWGIENGNLWVVQARPMSNAREETWSGVIDADDELACSQRSFGPLSSAHERWMNKQHLVRQVCRRLGLKVPRVVYASPVERMNAWK